MITLSDVSMRFGTQVLFEGASWQLDPQGHYGLVGANGTGKSTLLKLMTQELKPEGGSISIPNDLMLGTLGQDHFKYDEARLVDAVIMGKPRLWEAVKEKHALMEEIAHGASSEAQGHRLAELESVIADNGGYEAESQAGALLEGLGLSVERHHHPMKELSGGYRLRVLLAQTLFQEPSLLLLDEPTNHLDIVSIRWLEVYLRTFNGAFVVVSHDRHFLNSICNTMVDVDYQELRVYPGNYDRFEQAKTLAVEQKDAEIGRAEEKIAEMNKFIDRFKAKATKARQAQSRKKQVDKLAEGMPDIKRSSRRHPTFKFQQTRPSGKEVLAVEHLSKSYDGVTVLDDVSFTLMQKHKLAVVGPNGVGKSTLLKLIMEELKPDSGVARHGYEVHPGYFAQDHHEVLKGNASIYQWLHGRAPGESVGIIRGALGKVLFSGDDADKRLSTLSGGEAARLLLAGLMLKKPNLLILDEPTNHLDMEGREALMAALKAFEGTVIFVSHDRHFVSTVADRILALSWDGMEDYSGNYEEYLERQGTDYLEAGLAAKTRQPLKVEKPKGGTHDNSAQSPPKSSDKSSAKAATPVVEDYQQRKDRKKALSKVKKEVNRLEQEVVQIEIRLAEFETRFAQDGFFQDTPWAEVQKAQGEQAREKKRLEDVIARWEQASADLDALK